MPPSRKSCGGHFYSRTQRCRHWPGPVSRAHNRVRMSAIGQTTEKSKTTLPFLHGLDACVRYLGSLVSYAINSHGDLEYGVSTNPEWPNMAVPVHNRLFRCVRLTCRRHTLSLPRIQAGKVHRTPAFHDSQVSCSPTTSYIIGVYTPDAPEHDETVWLPPPPRNYGETHCSAVSPES